MATAVPSSGGGEHPIAMPPADGNAAAGSSGADELQQTESRAGDKVMWKQLKRLNDIVFYIELLEYSGNALGTMAFLWATVVMLGGFCSVLSRQDFWFATVMVFIEGTRVFISKDASANQWLFGSTRAFRWDHFCFSDINVPGSVSAVMIGAGISLVPIASGKEIIAGIFKVAMLAITGHLLARRRWGWFPRTVITLSLLAGFCGGIYGFSKLAQHYPASTRRFLGVAVWWWLATMAGCTAVQLSIECMVSRFRIPVLWCKVTVALALVCVPVILAKLGSKSTHASIPIATALLTVYYPEAFDDGRLLAHQEQSSNALVLETRDLVSKIVDTILPILFLWGVMFPSPGFSLKISFYMLLSVLAAVLVGNLQIPVAFLQILLSSLRLHSLLAGHHSHNDYNPLPDGASPNLVPSIVVFFVLELCQGSSNVLGIILGLISFRHRKCLLHHLGLKQQEWGAKAVNLYHHQACMTLKAKGLFHMEKSTPPTLDSFAIESLGYTSGEMQIVRLHVLDYYLQQGDYKSKRRLMEQIAKDAEGIVTKITGTISLLITDEEILSSALKLKLKQKQKQIRSSLSLCLNFLWRLAVAGGKMGTRFRQELSGNPILLHSIQRILYLEDCQQELWKPAMDVIKWLALHDEATAKETGSTHAVIAKLMGVFLNRDEGRSLRKAAGEELANLTITSSDNCRTILDILEASPAGRLDLIKNLISMLKDDEYISVAANLLHNLYANSGDMLINLDLDNDAKEGLKSSVRRMMQIIGNQYEEQQMEDSRNEEVTRLMDATLRIVSQIGYVIPKKDFAHVLNENLAPNNNAAEEKLVGKLVDTLKSNREPNREFPRLRRVLIETIISIVEACPLYIEIFRKKGAEEALKMLKRTSSILENYKVFVEGESMVPESASMQEVVDKAKRLIMVSGKSNQAGPALAR